ncbi:MAG: helix-turn-helix domain-containing protein [Candidatus Eremiobacteraeota bacterium]|nr:helix-turn-helix domain-containing protein [Candidatus Eremiobacteraeota bacterium]
MNTAQLSPFGELLREYRVAAKLTQEALAERARMSVDAVSTLERGARLRPRRATIELLADALSLSHDQRLTLERAARVHAAAIRTRSKEIKRASNLPVQLSSFIGRARDVTTVEELLENQRLVTLVGPGGIGKTRLALRAATRFAAEGDFDGIWFVDFSVIADGTMVVMKTASSIGVDQCRTIDALIGYLRSQAFLLIFDNCEHVLDSVAQLANAVISSCPDGRILATSRQALSLESEKVYRVLPLSVPPYETRGALSVSDALEFDAIRLFKERAQARDSHFNLTDSLVPALAEICQRVDGIALGIELAAARANAFSPATIARQIREHVSFLDAGIRMSPPRHKTMRALFDWSYDLLNGRERELFRRSSIFAGGFTLDLMCDLYAEHDEAIDIPDVLASLVDKSFVQCDIYSEPARYRLLEPARQYGREKLRESGEESATARSHALALLTLAERFDARLELVPDRDWDAYIERERENFRAALEWAIGPLGAADLAQRLAASRAACYGAFVCGDVDRFIDAALKTCDDYTPSPVRSKLELNSARAAVVLHEDAEAKLDAGRRALKLQEAHNLPGVAAAQYLVGRALQENDRYVEAEAALREARATARSCGALTEYTYATRSLALGCMVTGDLGEARSLLSEALRLHEAAGCNRNATLVKTTLAEIEFTAGNIEKALQLAEETIDVFKARNDSLHLAYAFTDVSTYLLGLRRYEEARTRAHEALRCASAIGQRRFQAFVLLNLAAVAAHTDCNNDGCVAELAANILGFVDEMQKRQHFNCALPQQQEYQKALAALRETFGEDQLNKFMAAGAQWPEERALAEALAL